MKPKTISTIMILLGQAFTLCTASATCLDVETDVSPYKVSLVSEIRTADAIVIGRVLSEQSLQEDSSDPYGVTAYNVSVRVLVRLKGDLPNVFIIRNENSSARYPFGVGEEHLLFVSREGRELWVNSCGNSTAMPGGTQLVKTIRAQLQSPK